MTKCMRFLAGVACVLAWQCAGVSAETVFEASFDSDLNARKTPGEAAIPRVLRAEGSAGPELSPEGSGYDGKGRALRAPQPGDALCYSLGKSAAADWFTPQGKVTVWMWIEDTKVVDWQHLFGFFATSNPPLQMLSVSVGQAQVGGWVRITAIDSTFGGLNTYHNGNVPGAPQRVAGAPLNRRGWHKVEMTWKTVRPHVEKEQQLALELVVTIDGELALRVPEALVCKPRFFDELRLGGFIAKSTPPLGAYGGLIDAFTIETEDDPSLFAQDPVQRLTEGDQEERIRNHAAKAWTFRPLNPKEHARTVLDFEVRCHSRGISGYTWMADVLVNGQRLPRTALVNKARDNMTAEGTVVQWYGFSQWLVYYTPDFAPLEATNRYAPTEGSPFRYVLDISDLVKRHQAENTITLRFDKEVLSNDAELVVRRMTVRPAAPDETGGGTALDDARRAVDPANLPRITPRASYDVECSVTPEESGAFAVVCNDRRVRLTSDFSNPGPRWSRLGDAAPDDLPWEHLAAETISPREFTLDAANARFTLRRRVRAVSTHVEVEDTFTNVSGADLGMVIRHCMALPGPAQRVHLCGMWTPMKEGVQQWAANPTVFAAAEGLGAGLVAMDDVFRLHAAYKFEDGRGVIEDRGFGLAAGASYTVRWWIVPVPSGDYWDFINSVRRAWNVNFEIPALFGIVDALPKTPTNLEAFPHHIRDFTDEQTLRWLDTYGLKWLGTGVPLAKGLQGWPHIATGSDFLSENGADTREVLKRLAERFRRLAPDVRVMCYMHALISTESDAVTKYADSVLRTSDGQVMDSPGGQGKWPMFYPTLENSYGRRMAEYPRMVLDTLGCGGIFWDEMQNHVIGYHGIWDGHTVSLNARTYEIAQKLNDAGLTTLPWKLKMTDYILTERKAALVGNGAPGTWTMTQVRFPRVLEVNTYSWLPRQHLWTPIGLGSHVMEQTEPDVYESILNYLDYAALHFKYVRALPGKDHVQKHVFPITPVELREGCILGEKKIITNRSGLYGWGDASAITAKLFGRPLGARLDHSFQSVSVEGKTYLKVLLEPGQIAILERP